MKALLLSLMLTVPAFAGPPTSFPETVKGVKPPDYLVRVFSFDESDETRSSGTGTLIRPDIVVTASHVVDGKVGAQVEILFFSTWDVVLGKVLVVSPNNEEEGRDVAIIKLDKPRSETPLELAEKIVFGSAEVRGFSHGPYTQQIGTYYADDKSKKWGIIRGAQARNGDSGGPILQHGKLAGVLWGSIENHTWFTPIQFLYELYPELKKVETKQDAPAIRIRYSL